MNRGGGRSEGNGEEKRKREGRGREKPKCRGIRCHKIGDERGLTALFCFDFVQERATHRESRERYAVATRTRGNRG